MGIGSGIFLLVAGAILAFAVGPDTWEVLNLNYLGYILMLGGVITLLLGLYYNKQRVNMSYREVVDHPEDRIPPAV
jgi:hypothetical protein